MKNIINKLMNKKNLTGEQFLNVMELMLSGGVTSAQIGSFLTALHLKGETIEEITACVKLLQKHCNAIHTGQDTLDIVGTGGDGLNTFNISTISSLVVAACGVPVTKHGGRSVSSKCGSADLLEALGVNIMLEPHESKHVFEETGICFMLSQYYYTFMKEINLIRREIGIRTILNIASPLVNPAKATMHLFGVYDPALVEPLAKVLGNIGVKRAMVVHGMDGGDEISMTGSTSVCEVSFNSINSYLITPEQFGFNRCLPEELEGGCAAENAEIALDILSGVKNAKRDSILLNSAFALYLSNQSCTINECIRKVAYAIDSGAAMDKLKQLIYATNNINYRELI